MKNRLIWVLLLIGTISILIGIIYNQKKILTFIGIKEYQNIPMETIPIKRTPIEAQREISNLLKKEPIKFKDSGYLLEDNKTINQIVSILNNTIGDIIIKVTSHSKKEGKSRYNRKLTQKRADTIASYIKDRYNVKFINAIGYGEEFPLKDSNKTDERIEIYLRRIYQ